jgi:hypothetical protein
MLQMIKGSELQNVERNMRVIDSDSFDQFVTKMIHWYQCQTHNDFFRNDTAREIPNVFDLFNYPGSYGEQVLYLFMDSEKNRRMDLFGESPSEAEDKVVRQMDNKDDLLYERMMGDAISVMDAYRLFYMYRDDVHNTSIYYNKFTVEVW